MSDEATVREEYERVVHRHGGSLPAPDDLLSHMQNRARGRLDYNWSRSGYAAPATELARYVLTLSAAFERLVREAAAAKEALAGTRDAIEYALTYDLTEATGCYDVAIVLSAALSASVVAGTAETGTTT